MVNALNINWVKAKVFLADTISEMLDMKSYGKFYAMSCFLSVLTGLGMVHTNTGLHPFLTYWTGTIWIVLSVIFRKTILRFINRHRLLAINNRKIMFKWNMIQVFIIIIMLLGIAFGFHGFLECHSFANFLAVLFFILAWFVFCSSMCEIVDRITKKDLQKSES